MTIPIQIPVHEPDSPAEKGGEPKYPKPKILLMDLKDNPREVLTSEGFNVEIGSFGRPYKVEKADSMRPVIPNARLPRAFEHDLVVIDLVPDIPYEQPVGNKVVSDGKGDWWTSCSTGMIDPRPRAMACTQGDFDRILRHGGAFIVYTSPRLEYDAHWAYVGRRGGLFRERRLDYDNWSFLSMLEKNCVSVTADSGEDIQASNSNRLSDLIIRYGHGAYFNCTLSREYRIDDKDWLDLADSKYGAKVSALIRIDNGEDAQPGWILLIHQIRDKAHFFLDLLTDFLPTLAPHLFPYSEKTEWMRQHEYELPGVLELRDRIEAIERDAARQVEEVENDIQEVRKAKKYLYDLPSETGDALVEAVIEALRVLGFGEVVDVDEQIRESGEDASLREDIQIKDSSPVLIVDVKGIAGRPSDAEAMQAHKHAVMRMKEWDRTDVNALSIINHQRHLPPLGRDNNMPFRKEIVDGTSQIDLGLMTAWELCRLVRSFIRNHWKPEDVKPLFYKRGRIEIIPLHYQYIGSVKQVWKKAGAVSIRVQNQPLKKGTRIAFEMPVEFEEQAVESLQIDGQDVEDAQIGVEVGIQTALAGHLRSGTNVYAVSDTSSL